MNDEEIVKDYLDYLSHYGFGSPIQTECKNILNNPRLLKEVVLRFKTARWYSDLNTISIIVHSITK